MRQRAPQAAAAENAIHGHEATITVKGKEFVLVARDQAAPRRFAVRWEEVGLPPLTLEIAIDNGKPRCVELVVDATDLPKGVTTGQLRDIPVRRIVKEAVASASGFVERSADGSITVRSPEWDERNGFVSEGLGRITSPIASDELLEEVAEVYRANPVAPAKAVHVFVNDRVGASRATAGRYIAAARKAGKLGKASPRKAGEF